MTVGINVPKRPKVAVENMALILLFHSSKYKANHHATPQANWHKPAVLQSSECEEASRML
jgi:hypothetical protein